MKPKETVEARFTTDECAGETFSLSEMVEANDGEGFDNSDLIAWLRAAEVGERWQDIVAVTRVS